MDLILFNAKIITMDLTLPKAEAVAINNGKISKVGTSEEILIYKKNNTKLIDLDGKLLLPGFIDSHMHLLNYGISLQLIDLEDTCSINDLIEKMKNFIKVNNIHTGKWVRGMRFNQHQFKEKRLPTKDDLNRVSTEHPIALSRVCGHVLVGNSKAMEVCDIDQNTPQVAGGHFEIDNNGIPLGIFRENAIFLIYNKIPKPSKNELKEYIKTAANKLLKFGITSVQSDDFIVHPESYEAIIEAYTELIKEDSLPILVYEQCNFKDLDVLKSFLENSYNQTISSDFFKLGPLKILADGSLGARTAYLKEPYTDDHNTNGIAVFTQDELDELVITAHNADMAVAIHAIGDMAIAMAFNSIDTAQKLNHKEKIRHSIIHCQITDSELLDRFKMQNVIAHIQPLFVSTDSHFVEDRIGMDRAATSYNWKSLLDREVNVAFGSDAPVESPNVFHGIYAAVTRKDLNGYPENGWLPDQKLTVEQVVYGYTLGAAYASYEENIKGSITEGKNADLIVLDNIFEMDIERIKNLEVDMTFVNGKLVYKR